MKFWSNALPQYSMSSSPIKVDCLNLKTDRLYYTEMSTIIYQSTNKIQENLILNLWNVSL